MTPPLAALLFFALWTLSLVTLGIGPYRVIKVLRREARSNSFTGGALEGPDWVQRLTRAHLNCVENLPVFGVLVIVGHLVGLREGLFASLAITVAVARVGQTVTHLLSGRSLVVNIRFTFFLVQLLASFTMGALILLRG